MPNPTGTGVVAYNDPLVRKAWTTEGLIQKAATSFWAPYKGSTIDSIIVVENDISKGSGHQVIFDFDGNLSGKPVKGKKTAKGTGEQKKKFNDQVTVADYRYVVDNGTKFDGVNIGDLSINQHSDSRAMLGDLWIRSEDQAYFDVAQQAAQFGLTFDASDFNLDALGKIETAAKTGLGYDVTPLATGRRTPLAPFKLQNGEKVWLLVGDVHAKRAFLKTSGATNALTSIDARGNENRIISGVIGKLGSFIFIEAPSFFGETEGDIISADGYYNYDNTGVEIAGLRQKDKAGKWTGQEDFDGTPTVSRCLVLGAAAIQKANGMAPDYKYEDTDFGKFSESCLEVWCGVKPVKLEASNDDYKDGKVSGYNYGLTYVDINLGA